jgi:hypothetical protein
MNAIRIFSICFLVSGALQAQQPDRSDIRLNQYQAGFGLGYQSRQLLDEQKSALVYHSNEYLGTLFFKNEKEKSLFLTSLDFSFGSFEARHKPGRQLYSVDYDIYGNATIDSMPVTSGIITGKFNMTYMRNFSNGVFRWLAGGTLQDQLIYPENYIGLLNSLSLNAALGVSKKIHENHTVSAKLELPVLALNTRLPWHNTATDPVKSELSTFFKKGTRLVSLDKYQSIQFNLNYSFRLSTRMTLGVDYAFDWIRIPYYQPMKSYVNQISIFTSYNF